MLPIGLIGLTQTPNLRRSERVAVTAGVDGGKPERLAMSYGRTGGVGRGLGVAVDLGIAVGVGLGVGVAVGVGVIVGVGVGANSSWINSMRPPLPNSFAWTAFEPPTTYCPSLDTSTENAEPGKSICPIN